MEAYLLQARTSWSTWPLWKKLLLGVPVGLALLALAIVAGSRRRPPAPATVAVRDVTEDAAEQGGELARELHDAHTAAEAVLDTSHRADEVIDIYADEGAETTDEARALRRAISDAETIEELEAIAERMRR